MLFNPGKVTARPMMTIYDGRENGPTSAFEDAPRTIGDHATPPNPAINDAKPTPVS